MARVCSDIESAGANRHQPGEKEVAHRKARRVRRAENALDVLDELLVAVVDDVVGHRGNVTVRSRCF